MNTLSWKRVREIFESALELPDAERPEYVETACQQDATLRSEVDRLLAHHRDDDFLTTPEPSARAALLTRPFEGLAQGSDFAGFEILGVLGTGGMGCVYEARQPSPRRRVALKVLRVGSVSRQAAARFHWEAELLGRLRHPGIAQVFATGVEPEGGGGDVPWFALELVDGALPITQAVVERGLDRSAALELFALTCDAVQHGHQHGVIHRDLKPANILVGSDGRVKVIDFGVAGVTERDEGISRLTQAGDLLGTLGTMSPEQLGGDSTEVDARADVYALGAILHELLCQAPLHDLGGCSITEIAQRVRTVAPLRPSQRRPGVPEELDWIVARAVEREPERRYAAVSELAAEVRRYLAREPVLAGPPSATYRVRTFVRRHKVGVSAGAAVLLTLLVGIFTTTRWMIVAEENERRAAAETIRAESETIRAESEAALAQAVTDFVIGLIRSPDPALDGNEVRVVDVLARADEQLALSLVEHPEIAATLHGTLGKLHYNLGLLDGAEQHLSAALELGATADSADRGEYLTARAALGAVRREAGDLAGAEAELLAVHAERRALHGDDHGDTAASLSALALLRHAQGQLVEAEQLYKDSLQVMRRHLGTAHEYVLRTEANLAGLYLASDQRGEAEQLFTDTLPRMREHLGPRHPATVTIMANLASLYVATRRFELAVPLLDEVMSIHRETLPVGHPSLLADLSNLSVLRLQLGQFDEAIALCSEVIDVRGAEHPRAADVILMRCNRIHMSHGAGDGAAVAREVDALLALDLAQSLDNVVPLSYVENLSRDLAQWGDYGRGLQLVQTSLAGRMRLAPNDPGGLFGAWRACAIVVALAGDDPSPVFEQLWALSDQLPAERQAGLEDEVALALSAFGSPQAAEQWRAFYAAGR